MRGESEAERLFALGWLHWLDGAFVEAESALVMAVEIYRQANATPQLAEAAYWLARVRIRLDRQDAVNGFETLLRQLGGSPQATVWFVDLLWRTGWVGRAEQVWKAVRGNKRVAVCPDGPLLEARLLLQRGEVGGAVKVLVEVQPANGVHWVERQLLLAWAEAAQGRRDKALELMRRIEELPYPRAALATWRAALEGALPSLADESEPLVLRDLKRGYRELTEGRTMEAVEAFRAAQGQQSALPFARFALARLGYDSFAALLAVQSGLFIAVRCRVWLALERFRLRQGNPAEWLETLQHESRLGFIAGPIVEHYRRLAQLLRQPADSEALCDLVEQQEQFEPSVYRNVVRAALEVVRRLPSEEARELIAAWGRLEWLTAEEELRCSLQRQSLQLTLRETNAADLLSDEPLLQPASQLWQAATELKDDDSWREQVRALRSSPRLRPLTQALLLQEAAQRGDVTGVVALLDETDVWRGFRPAPPVFVLRTVQSVVHGQPSNAGLRRSIARWLQIWDLDALGQPGSSLAALVGLLTVPASRAEAPPGIPIVPWLFHQAARTLGHEDYIEALACVRRAEEVDPEWASAASADLMRTVLPDLERRAVAQSLAAALRETESEAVESGRLLTDVVDLLRQHPDGAAILNAAVRGDRDAVREGLALLLNQADLPPRLAHHLALIEMRSALALEDRDNTAAAEAHWRRAWTAWLRLLATPPGGEGLPVPDAARMVLDTLLADHRRRISGLLARNAVDAARRYWALVQELPALAALQSAPLGQDLVVRVERFRDELASEYLVMTRESMRYGDVPEGCARGLRKGSVAPAASSEPGPRQRAAADSPGRGVRRLVPRPLQRGRSRSTDGTGDAVRSLRAAAGSSDGGSVRRVGCAGSAVGILQVPRVRRAGSRREGGTVPRGAAVQPGQ